MRHKQFLPVCTMTSFYYYNQILQILLSSANQGFSYLNLAGITKFKYEKKNEKHSGCSSKMTSSCKWPIISRCSQNQRPSPPANFSSYMTFISRNFFHLDSRIAKAGGSIHRLCTSVGQCICMTVYDLCNFGCFCLTFFNEQVLKEEIH